MVSNFKINQKLEIHDGDTIYKCSVQDVVDGTVLVNMPISDKGAYPMHTGTVFEFQTATPIEVNVYRTTVLGKKTDGRILLIALETPKFVNKIQRREYFRLPIALNIQYYMLQEDKMYNNLLDIPSGYYSRMTKALTIDISGGGLKIVTKEAIPKGRYVIVTMDLNERLAVLCKSVWTERDEVERNYRTALNFINIDERLRDKIIRFIFAKLRDQSKLLK